MDIFLLFSLLFVSGMHAQVNMLQRGMMMMTPVTIITMHVPIAVFPP
jgi:hypothetical protein